MARPRVELQELLETITENVYLQSPPNIEMLYPCILYERSGSDGTRQNTYADNIAYRHTKRYQVTVIDRDPDTELSDKVEELPYCGFDRYYAVDGLHHFVFTLFF
jgi:hypothetical protein